MRCDQFAALAHDLLDGSLPAEIAGQAEGHAETCAACRRDLAALRRLGETLRESPTRPLGERLRRRVAAALLAAAEAEVARPEIMTLSQVAAYLSVPEADVRAALSDLPHFAVGTEVRVRRATLERWIERRESRSGAACAAPVLTLLSADVVPGLLAG